VLARVLALALAPVLARVPVLVLVPVLVRQSDCRPRHHHPRRLHTPRA
jgi:hypothetical protein